MVGTVFSYAETLSPLAQTTQGIPDNEVVCRSDLVLMVRDSGNPLCLTPASYLRSVDRGWGNGDLDLLEKNPSQLDAVVATVMLNSDLRAQILEEIKADPHTLILLKSNKKLVSIVEGKGIIGDHGDSSMGGMFGSTAAGKQMEQAMASMGFRMGDDSSISNLVGKMVDAMMPKVMQGMENSPMMGAQMRTDDKLVEDMLEN